MAHLFSTPPAHPLIAPSILSADFGIMASDAGHVLASPSASAGGGAGADLLHIDVMDGHFAPNLTMGPDMVKGLRKHLPEAFLDVHLMVMDPARFIEPFAKAGANHCTFHIERLQGEDAIMLADHCRTLGMTAGICLNPHTPPEQVLRVIHAFDLVLIMSVNPGFSGQKFMPEVLPKAAAIKKHLKPTQRLEIDGGVTTDNAASVRAAGVDVIVAATAIFGKPREARAQAVAALRS
ncbi:MAG: ribulose-phosphate 3-epimerase [Tepidisphaera sp.]